MTLGMMVGLLLTLTEIRPQRSYLPPVQIGETMRAGAIGTIVKGNAQFKEGDIVHGTLG